MIQVSGDMPEHRHGMPTQPQVTQNLGGGDYLVEGMRFQMGGWWAVTFAIDADGGGRLYLQVADADDIQIGARVALTYRRLHEGAGNRNYYWKARPIREE